MSRFPWIAAVLLALLATSSLSSAAAFAGLLRGGTPAPLVAEVRLQLFQLPAEFGIDPATIAGFLVTQLKERADKDVALEVILGTEGARQMRDVVLPRLVHPDLIARMVGNIPPLQTLIDVQNYRVAATVSVRNSGATPLNDVALTLPGALKAETAEGPLVVVAPVDGLQVIRLGELQPDQTIAFQAWLDRTLDDDGALERRIRVGAAGVDGSVLVYGHRGWAGEAFETNIWGRWAAWAILLGVAVGSLGLLGWIVIRAIRPSTLSTGRH